MSDKLVPLSIHKLLNWIFEEYRVNNTIFGIHKDLFFTPDSGDVFRMKRYGKSIDSPIGVAAGPHTQMAQNIIAAWLCGARYIELKTIQTLDELEISKPCIDMEDEGYNCEWSQELKLRQSFSEYLKAWIIIHILKHKLGHGKPDELGGIFNLSAGYDLKGILNPNVQEFLDLMEHCPAELQQELALAADVFPEIHQLNIPDKISDNLTLSTMHGCPSDEIEKIAAYFLTERHYHTTVKLNPTLLGPERLRKTLHGFLKFNRVVVPDEAFEHDLKYEDALKLIQNLEAIADRENLKFGLKLTNTLEVLNTKQIFPEKEAQAYLSGRALHPISIQVAACLQEDFRGELDISFSAGVDAFNLPHVIACNIKPVTTCTDILKPGGYTRLKQYLDHLAEIIRQNEAESIDDYILMKADEGLSVKSAGLYNLQKYAESVIHDPAYRDRPDNYENIKTPRTLTKFDCVKAPCITACATDQNIPDYMYWTAQGDFDKALKVILDTNPMPGSTGYVCDHLCQLKCTRNNIDNSLLIREIKRFAVEHGNAAVEKETAEKLNSRVAVIGAGPSGLSCAYFLARKGHQVVIFEKGEKAGGMVSGAIPHFRLADETFDGDLKFITDSGVEIRYHSKIDKAEFTKIQNEYDSIYLSTGAQLNKQLNIQGEDLPGVIEPLEFLHSVKAGNLHEIGTRIAIIGGGNTAIDAARTARRLAGPTSHVDILYRRTRKEMPADYDEIQDAIEEGITLKELVSPVSIHAQEKGLSLVCIQMKLGVPDSSGRARPEPVAGSEFRTDYHTIIPAVGQDVDSEFLPREDLVADPDSLKIKVDKVYSGGDALRGASSVINAIGDGQIAARSIHKTLINGEQRPGLVVEKNLNTADFQKKLAFREFGPKINDFITHGSMDFNLCSVTMTQEQAIKEASRCLFCDDICNICVSVCPNLANVSIQVKADSFPVYEIKRVNGQEVISPLGRLDLEQLPQILNIVDFCNECGNCTTFCPTSGDPYRDKSRLHLSLDSFDQDENGYLFTNGYLTAKHNGQVARLSCDNNQVKYSGGFGDIIVDRKSMEILKTNLTEPEAQFNTQRLCEMLVLFENIPDYLKKLQAANV